MHSIKHTNNIIIGKHMKMSCFKFHQNRIINEEFDYWEVKGQGERCPNLKKKASYRTVVPIHTVNFSTLAQLKLFVLFSYFEVTPIWNTQKPGSHTSLWVSMHSAHCTVPRIFWNLQSILWQVLSWQMTKKEMGDENNILYSY